jgi:hypothetical protein
VPRRATAHRIHRIGVRPARLEEMGALRLEPRDSWGHRSISTILRGQNFNLQAKGNFTNAKDAHRLGRDRARVPRSLAFAEGRQLRGAGRDGLHDSLRERRSREQQGPWAALHGAAAVPHDLDRLLVDDQPLLPPSDAQQQLGSVWDHLLATSPRPAKHRRLLLPEPQPGARQVLFALDSVVSEGRSRPRSRRGQRADDARRLANLQRMAKDVPPVAA